MWVMVASNSMGVKPPSASWPRWRWYFFSIQTTMARRRSWRVRQRCWLRTLVCSSYQNDSIAALSPAEATRPIEPIMSWRLSAAAIFRERNCDPRSA